VNDRSPELAALQSQSIAPHLTCDEWLDCFATAWRADHRFTAAQFADRHPDLSGEDQLLAMLAYEEFRLREHAGERVDSQLLMARFPRCVDAIQALIEVHRTLPSESEMLAALAPSRAGPLNAEPLPAPPTLRRSPVVNRRWPRPGQQLGGFKLLEVLGSGAYARVYLAEEDALGRRRVVVKASVGGTEADTLGKLLHPNIVPVHSVQVDGRAGLTLICMPFLGRLTLHDALARLRDGNFPPTRAQALLDAVAPPVDEQLPATAVAPWFAKASYVEAVVHLGVQLAEALDYANSKGIVHGDLKPSNILIDGAGKPMLLDFNLSYDDQRQTRGVGGTPGYAAPEIIATLVASQGQARTSPDLRHDLYSLGVVLYELLAGELPYGEPSLAGAVWGAPPGRPPIAREWAARWLARQRHGPRPLAELNRAVEPALAALIERCLAFDVESRPATASEVAAALRPFLSRPGRLKRWSWRHRRGLAATLLPLCGLLTLGGYQWTTLPTYAERQFAAAQRARGRGDFSAVLGHLDQAALHGFDRRQIAPLAGDVYYRLAQRAFADRDFSLARDQAAKAVESARPTWQGYLLRARAQFHLREYELALKDVGAAEDRRAAPEIHAARGDCFCGLSKWDSAVAAYQTARAAGFESPGLMNNLAYALAQSGRRKEALGWLDRAIRADNGLTDAFYQRAAIGAAMAADDGTNIPASAMEDIEAAIELGPNNCWLFRSAADIYARRSVQSHDGSLRLVAIDRLLQSLRLGLEPSALPSGGPLGEIASEIDSAPESVAAVALGAQSIPCAPPGIVDSLAGVEFD
jgi:serine/threonine protein kinase